MTASGPPAVLSHLPDDGLAGLSKDAADHLIEHGDVLRDGDTVEGPEPGASWTCRHEQTLVAPDRIAVGLDPGPMRVAGGGG